MRLRSEIEATLLAAQTAKDLYLADHKSKVSELHAELEEVHLNEVRGRLTDDQKRAIASQTVQPEGIESKAAIGKPA